MGDEVLTSTADGIRTITLNRPDALNAFDTAASAALLAAFEAAAEDADVRAVILTGAGRAFCAGADVSDLATAGSEGADVAALHRGLLRRSARLARALWTFDKPFVTAVNGIAAGAGAAMAICADVVVASEHASFAFLFSRRGLVPDFGSTWLLPRLVGLRAARELCLLGERVDAERAVALGLASRVVAHDALADDATAVARRLAEGPGVALRLTKRLLADAFERGHDEAVGREFDAQALCFTTEDAREGAAAFLEKRAAAFRGR